MGWTKMSGEVLLHLKETTFDSLSLLDPQGGVHSPCCSEWSCQPWTGRYRASLGGGGGGGGGREGGLANGLPST